MAEAEAPIPFKSLTRRIKARDPLGPPPAVALRKTMFLPGDEPRVEVSTVEAVRPLFQENGSRMFKVEVDAVRTVNQRGKEKRFGRSIGRRDHVKKAYVALKPGHELNFSGEAA